MSKIDLPPGEELDRLVAEIVMSWSSSDGSSWFDGAGVRQASVARADNLSDSDRFAPSEDKVAALLVIECMCLHGWRVSIDARVEWSCSFYTSDVEYYGESTSLAHAICLGALGALDAELLYFDEVQPAEIDMDILHRKHAVAHRQHERNASLDDIFSAERIQKIRIRLDDIDFVRQQRGWLSSTQV